MAGTWSKGPSPSASPGLGRKYQWPHTPFPIGVLPDAAWEGEPAEGSSRRKRGFYRAGRVGEHWIYELDISNRTLALEVAFTLYRRERPIEMTNGLAVYRHVGRWSAAYASRKRTARIGGPSPYSHMDKGEAMMMVIRP